ncbi:MAG: hypothetical protein WAT92_22120 [Saprospiraceae bacterium]
MKVIYLFLLIPFLSFSDLPLNEAKLLISQKKYQAAIQVLNSDASTEANYYRGFCYFLLGNCIASTQALNLFIESENKYQSESWKNEARSLITKCQNKTNNSNPSIAINETKKPSKREQLKADYQKSFKEISLALDEHNRYEDSIKYVEINGLNFEHTNLKSFIIQVNDNSILESKDNEKVYTNTQVTLKVDNKNFNNPNPDRLTPSIYITEDQKPTPPEIKTIVNNPMTEEPEIKTIVNNPMTEESEIKTIVTNPMTEEPEIKTIVDNPITEEPEIKTIANNPMTQEHEIKTIVNNPMTEEPEIKTIVNNPMTEEPEIKTIVNNPMTEEPEIKTIANNPMTEEPEIKTIVNNPMTEDPKIKTNVNNPMTEEPDRKEVTPKTTSEAITVTSKSHHFKILFAISDKPDQDYLSLMNIGPVSNEKANGNNYIYYLGFYPTKEKAETALARVKSAGFAAARVMEFNSGTLEKEYVDNKDQKAITEVLDDQQKRREPIENPFREATIKKPAIEAPKIEIKEQIQEVIKSDVVSYHILFRVLNNPYEKFEDLKQFGPLYRETFDAIGNSRYLIGNTDDVDIAKKLLEKVKKAGYPASMVAEYINGQLTNIVQN